MTNNRGPARLLNTNTDIGTLVVEEMIILLTTRSKEIENCVQEVAQCDGGRKFVFNHELCTIASLALENAVIQT